MPNRKHDPSIEHEPHLLDGLQAADPSEEKASRRLSRESAKATDHDHVDHNVWEEPVLNAELAGEAGDEQLTYARWLAKNIRETSWAKSWFITLGVALVAGPFAIFGALFSQPELGIASAAGMLAIAVFAPLVEEIMKVAAALWVVEKRPFWFKSIGQILLCGLAGGIMFGAIENLLYLFVYIPDAAPSLARWRWTVCVGLHMNCSFIAAVGVARIWHNAIREQHRPHLGLGMPWLCIAIIGHGLYNFSVAIAESMGWLKLE